MKEKNFSISKRLKSFCYAFDGIRYLIKNEHNAWIHCSVAIIVLFAGLFFNISPIEWIVVVFVIASVLAAEAINSSIECLADFVSDKQCESIKHVKDLAAGAVLFLAIAAAIIGCIIFVPKVFDFFFM